jgi:hypothetical protein
VANHSFENSDHLRELREKLRRDSRDSFQLLENFWDNPICFIIHDEDSHCIIVVWKQYATRSSSGISMRICSRSSAGTAFTRFLATTQLCLPSLRRTDSGLSISGFRGLWNAVSALPPVKDLLLILASSLSATSSRGLPPALSADPSSSCTKRRNGSRPLRPRRLARLALFALSCQDCRLWAFA